MTNRDRLLELVKFVAEGVLGCLVALAVGLHPLVGMVIAWGVFALWQS